MHTTMSIYDYFGEWGRLIDLPMVERVTERVMKAKGNLCPKLSNVFNAFLLCQPSKLRVVVVGQDPYSNFIDNQPVATGIAFANKKETKEDAYSPSLEVIKDSIIDFSLPHNRINFDPSLETWEEQGVMMLNASLTCERGRTGSHALIWRPFTASLLKSISDNLVGIVFVLLGSDAQSFEECIDSQFHHVIKEKHPSWYARTGQRMPNIWKQVNEILIGQNDLGIKWYEEIEY